MFESILLEMTLNMNVTAISSNIDAQTLREVYLLPFEMGIKEGNAKVVMSAYNKLNNIFCSSHQELLINQDLKRRMGF
jgi:beta-glucosidase